MSTQAKLWEVGSLVTSSHIVCTPLLVESLCEKNPSAQDSYEGADPASVTRRESEGEVSDEGRASLVVQWLRICLPIAADTGPVPGPGRSHMPQGI